MKKFLIIAALALASALFLTNCNKAEEEGKQYYGFSEEELGELVVVGESEAEIVETASNFLKELRALTFDEDTTHSISMVENVLDKYDGRVLGTINLMKGRTKDRLKNVVYTFTMGHTVDAFSGATPLAAVGCDSTLQALDIIPDALDDNAFQYRQAYVVRQGDKIVAVFQDSSFEDVYYQPNSISDGIAFCDSTCETHPFLFTANGRKPVFVAQFKALTAAFADVVAR